MKVDLFLSTFLLIVSLVGIVYPILGFFEIKKLKFQFNQGIAIEKIRFFNSNMIWAWFPVLLIVLSVFITPIDFQSIGFKWIHISFAEYSSWLIYPVSGFYLLYLLYSIYTIYMLKTNQAYREMLSKDVPDHFRIFLPVSKEEKKTWNLVAITAGVAEEIIYRGYFFYCFSFLFPELSIFYILIITTLIFGVGHIYLGQEVIKSTLLGLVFGLFYIVFDSLLPVILIHILQDLSVKDLLSEQNSH